MPEVKYQPLFDTAEHAAAPPARRRWTQWVTLGLLACSVVTNIFLLFRLHRAEELDGNTSFAGLTYNTPVPWERENAFHNGNRTAEDAAWSQAPGFGGEVGMIALPQALASSLGLPPAMHWPWDKSRDIYVVEAMHVIHCLKDIRAVVNDAYDGKPPSRPAEHVVHCVDSMRQFAMCHADDTPRYKGRLFPEITKDNPHGGFGQVRMCRDWSRLMDWMVEWHACYRPVPSDTPGFKEEDNYKSCPDGRVLWD